MSHDVHHMTDFGQALVDAGGKLAHHFGGGVYAKEMRIPAWQEVMQHKHSFDHLSVLAAGKVLLTVDGVSRVLEGPACVVIEAGKHHKVTTMTDTAWYCIHATDCTDADAVDEQLIAGD